MDDFSNPYRTYPTNTGRKLDVVNGRGYAVNSLYVGGRSRQYNRPLPAPSPMFDIVSRTSSSEVSSKSNNNYLFNGQELKRRKRIAEYKWYAVEGKVKASLKNGYRWFKRRCSQIVRGF